MAIDCRLSGIGGPALITSVSCIAARPPLSLPPSLQVLSLVYPIRFITDHAHCLSKKTFMLLHALFLCALFSKAFNFYFRSTHNTRAGVMLARGGSCSCAGWSIIVQAISPILALTPNRTSASEPLLLVSAICVMVVTR